MAKAPPLELSSELAFKKTDAREVKPTLSQDGCVCALTEIAGLSEAHFSRSFQQAFGVSPSALCKTFS
jgi:transcriptional regulator GlxA family with amidase domain